MRDILQSSFAMLSVFPILEIFPSPSSRASPSSVSLHTNKKLEKNLQNPCQETHQEIHLLATALDKEFLFWGTSHGFLLAKKHNAFLPLARSFYCWTHFGLLSLLFLSLSLDSSLLCSLCRIWVWKCLGTTPQKHLCGLWTRHCTMYLSLALLHSLIQMFLT